MLDYSVLNRKPLINLDGEQCYDLLAPIYKINSVYKPKLIIVNEYYVARPDLLSFAIYGDDKYADIICKVNGISNPFEMNENDTIILPNIEWLNECLDTNVPASKLVEDEDTDTIQDTDKYNFQKRRDELRSPNEQTLGDSNYVIDKSIGIVFY